MASKGSPDLTTATVEFKAVDEDTAMYLEGMEDPIPVDFDLDTDRDGTVTAVLEIEARSLEISDPDDSSEDEDDDGKIVEADEIELVVEDEDGDTTPLPITDVDFSIGSEVDKELMDHFDGDTEFTGSMTLSGEEAETLFDTLDTVDHSIGHDPDPAEITKGSMPSGVDGDPDYTTREFEVEADVAETVYDKVLGLIEQARKEGYEAEEVVLGVPQYKALAVYAQNYYGDTVGPVEASPEHLLGEYGIDVTCVPGPMIHVVKDNREVLFQHG